MALSALMVIACDASRAASSGSPSMGTHSARSSVCSAVRGRLLTELGAVCLGKVAGFWYAVRCDSADHLVSAPVVGRDDAAGEDGGGRGRGCLVELATGDQRQGQV